MTEHRHDFWGSTGRKEADVTRYDFSHPFLLPKAREFPSQGEPAISRGFGAPHRFAKLPMRIQLFLGRRFQTSSSTASANLGLCTRCVVALHQVLFHEPLLPAIKSAAYFVAKAGIDTRHR